MQQEPNIAKAALWTGGALLSFMMMAIGGREAAAELNTFQILFFRSVVGLLIVSLILAKSGWGQVRTAQPKSHLFRNLAHYVGQYGWFYGVAIIPLSEVFAIEFTTPIWIAIIAVFFLKEKMTKAKMTAIALGLIGTLVILRPGSGIMNVAALAVLIGAIGYAISHAMTKKMTATDTPLCIIFYMIVIQLPLGFFPSLEDWVWPSLTSWGWLTILGVTALSAHYCIAHAFRLADATVVIPMDFLRLPLVTLVGYLFYAEAIDIWLFVGALITLSGNLINIKAERKKEKATA